MTPQQLRASLSLSLSLTSSHALSQLRASERGGSRYLETHYPVATAKFILMLRCKLDKMVAEGSGKQKRYCHCRSHSLVFSKLGSPFPQPSSPQSRRNTFTFFILFSFTYICVCVSTHVWVCVYVCRCPQRPEEDLYKSGTKGPGLHDATNMKVLE